MLIRVTFVIVCLGWFVVPSQADDPPKYKAIDAKTIAAYERLGAHYGFGAKGFRREFLPGRNAAANELPGFQIDPREDGTLPQLPSVQVPFGLDLSFTEVKDAGLKELKQFVRFDPLQPES